MEGQPSKTQRRSLRRSQKRRASSEDGKLGRTDDIYNIYDMGKTLGTGQFATVRDATFKEDGSSWAIKCIEKARLLKRDMKGLLSELHIMKNVNHPHIVQMREIFESEDYVYIVMEKVDGGELFDHIIDKEMYTEDEAKRIIRHVGDALIYCHMQGIVHRDLKPENLLVTEEDDTNIKIADFGLAKMVGDDELMKTRCGTPGYVAPEVLKGELYGPEVDIWSVGVITYILLCGFPPFNLGGNDAALYNASKKADYCYPSPEWDDISKEAKDFIDQCLQVDHKKRPTAVDLLKQKWIAVKRTPGNRERNQNLRGSQRGMQQYQETRKAAKRTGSIVSRITTGIANLGNKMKR